MEKKCVRGKNDDGRCGAWKQKQGWLGIVFCSTGTARYWWCSWFAAV